MHYFISASCIVILVLSDIPQNTDVFNTFAGFLRVYSSVRGAECLPDGDAAADSRRFGRLRPAGMLY